jgi:hypothetical protein
MCTVPKVDGKFRYIEWVTLVRSIWNGFFHLHSSLPVNKSFRLLTGFSPRLGCLQTYL